MLASLMAGSSSGMASPGLISLTLRLIGQFFVFWFNGVSGFLLVYEFGGMFCGTHITCEENDDSFVLYI